MTLGELSQILLVNGKQAKALKVADKSCTVAESQKVKCEHAQSLIVQGRIATRLGRAEADVQIKTAENLGEAENLGDTP